MILLIDNYDSFTYNLVDYFKQLGQEIVVKRNNKISIDEAKKLNPSALVISPGPCGPEDSGICIKLVKEFEKSTPILGVCLGHQVIGHFYGAKIIKASEPVHGKINKITHKQESLFNDVPTSFDATRYHSLIIDPKTIPDCLQITANSNDGNIMSIKHRKLPIWGVQFHPESITTEFGMKILSNFLESIE